MMDKLRAVFGCLRRLTEYCAMTLLTGMTVIITWQVFSRFFLGRTPSWAQELSLLFMVWLGFLSVAIGVQDDLHIKITLLTSLFPKRVQCFLGYFNRVLTIFFGWFMLQQGFKFSQSMGGSLIPSLNIPSSVLYMAAPVTGALIVIYLLAEFINAWVPGQEGGKEEECHQQ
ncbi:TRAP transporter small permease [Neomoorella thermoacetica]|uniref:TRAP transporter small permease n=1 Tax=Neomoorella thermoacetica TaxID=1525 RepID=UPI0004704B11|nr:TRAP transporter small permease [Moorella thermoacetica]